ncbi:MAG: endonuclease [Syntrophomonadaceae bacterium]
MAEAVKHRLMTVFDRLLAAYGPRHWWPAETPYEMMVGAILTQNTAWTNAEKAINNFSGRLSPEFVAAVSLEELAGIIKPCGYFNQKARHLKHLTSWFETFDYDVNRVLRVDGQSLRRELLAVKGVGPETADSILLYALDQPFFVIDVYTRRLLSRIGWEETARYEQLRLEMESLLPRDTCLYGEFHALIVEHAKHHCRKKPACTSCPLADLCRQRGDELAGIE